VLNLKTAKNDGSFSSGSEPCLLAPSLLRDMQVLAENAEKSSQLIIFTKRVEPSTFWLIPAAELQVAVSPQSSRVAPKAAVQVYGLCCRSTLVCSAGGKVGAYVC